MVLSTPVAFFIFNRHDLAEITFAAIAQAKPQQLFVIADGARFLEEEEKCQKTRAVIEQVDWECDVRTNFSDKNLGCGRRISSGLDWVFSQVEEAIILEDDCLPTPSFFNYCQTLLKYYRNDERIMHINGDNSLRQVRNSYSYFFSKYMHCWGWASWRRAWNHFDYDMKSWPSFQESGMLESICNDYYEQKFWTNIWDRVHKDSQIQSTWAYQWTYACMSQGGLTITPNQNLVSNTGFNRADSTHTTSSSPRSNVPTNDIWEVEHPPFVARDRKADIFTFDTMFGGKELRENDTLSGKARQFLRSTKQTIMASKKKSVECMSDEPT